MSKYKYPEELKYSETHNWVLAEDDSQIVVVGVTDYVQDNLGEILSIELPDSFDTVDVGDEVCSIDATNTSIEIFTPLAGEIIAINYDLVDAPTIVNSDPYGDGWLYKLKLADKEEYNELLDVDEYIDLVDEEDSYNDED